MIIIIKVLIKKKIVLVKNKSFLSSTVFLARYFIRPTRRGGKAKQLERFLPCLKQFLPFLISPFFPLPAASRSLSALPSFRGAFNPRVHSLPLSPSPFLSLFLKMSALFTYNAPGKNFVMSETSKGMMFANHQFVGIYTEGEKPRKSPRVGIDGVTDWYEKCN